MSVELIPVAGIPEVREGDDLAELIAAGSPSLRDGDVVVIAQKVVSKAEGRVRRLREVEPGARARAVASEHGKDARLVQVVLDETARLLRAERGVLICETRHGYVCANAGVDQSNTGEEGAAILLPEDPDASARRIRAGLQARMRSAMASGHAEAAATDAARPAESAAAGADPRIGVVIADSFGRAWRLGTADVAIGAAGVVVLEDWRGRPDAHGRALRVTEVAVADQVAAAADLARAKDSQEPAVVVRGLPGVVTDGDGPGAAALRRPAQLDLFR